MTRHYYSYCSAPAGQLLEVENQKRKIKTQTHKRRSRKSNRHQATPPAATTHTKPKQMLKSLLQKPVLAEVFEEGHELKAPATSRGFISTAPSLITRLELDSSLHHQHPHAGRIAFTSRSSFFLFFLVLTPSRSRAGRIRRIMEILAFPPPRLKHLSAICPDGSDTGLPLILSSFGVGAQDWDWARCGRRARRWWRWWSR
ncbi:hypothetical protein R3P38DRAFT_3620491 [Favolaschia claudopus]|uniref:Uncharacterized protein n=1 Tax=Favolaschia claudopus TaxID=2862362 RepID=A0AAW0DCG5_9AGAR